MFGSDSSGVALEELHRTLVPLCRLQGSEGPQVTTLTRRGVAFAGIKPIPAGLKLSNHGILLSLGNFPPRWARPRAGPAPAGKPTLYTPAVQPGQADPLSLFAFAGPRAAGNNKNQPLPT